MKGLSAVRPLVLVVVAALLLASCGGDDSDSSSSEPEETTFVADDVVAAFEEAAGGYGFEEATTLVEGAVAYAPINSADVEEVAPLNEGLGDSSVLWTIVIFDGPDPPLDSEAAKEVAFASKTFEEAAPGIFIGDSDIGYSGRGNVVVTGPVLDGDVGDATLAAWKSTLDGL